MQHYSTIAVIKTVCHEYSLGLLCTDIITAKKKKKIRDKNIVFKPTNWLLFLHKGELCPALCFSYSGLVNVIIGSF